MDAPTKQPPSNISPYFILGGSFDPIHEGHIDLAKKITENFPVKKIYFIPAYQNPLKSESPGASPEQRLEMVTRALAEIGDPRFAVLDWEVARPVPSYSVDTVDALGAQLGCRVTLTLGDEVFTTLPKWKNPARLLTRADLLVVTRTANAAAARASADATVAEIFAGEAGGAPVPRPNIAWLKIDALPVSATAIRADLQKRWESNNLSTSPRGIQRAVWQFIKANRVYSRN